MAHGANPPIRYSFPGGPYALNRFAATGASACPDRRQLAAWCIVKHSAGKLQCRFMS
jgi:hypothetical protein